MAVGFSNGAHIAGALLLLRPEVIPTCRRIVAAVSAPDAPELAGNWLNLLSTCRIRIAAQNLKLAFSHSKCGAGAG